MEKRESSNQTFKVGDKVRILKTGAIVGIKAEEGTILEVVGIDVSDGTPYLLDIDGESCCTVKRELQYLEKVESKPTKNQRIKTLEEAQAILKETVEQLKERVEQLGALVESQSTPVVQNITVKSDADVSEIAERLVARLHRGETVKPTLTPNQRRKAIIDEAKAFVAELVPYINGTYDSDTKYGKIGGKISWYRYKTDFIVNEAKRTVVVLLKKNGTGELAYKAIAKCAPDDVFNADIGKAIALGRALGLDVARFEQAVKPTEAVVGTYVHLCNIDDYVTAKSHTLRLINSQIESNISAIVDDTEAEY